MCWETQLLRANFLWVIFALLYLFWPKHTRLPNNSGPDLHLQQITKVFRSWASKCATANVNLAIEILLSKSIRENESTVLETNSSCCNWTPEFWAQNPLLEFFEVMTENNNSSSKQVENYGTKSRPSVSINPQTQPQAASWVISGSQKSPPINL